MEDRGILKLAAIRWSLLAAFSLVVVSLLAICIAAEFAEAEGPWRAQVIDAETGAPLQGVVVVAIWTKKSPGFIHYAEETWDVEETVTDADGRMTISAKDTRTYVPGTAIVGPQIQMFKGGYGHWGFRDTAALPKLGDPILASQLGQRQWEKFTQEGVVIQLAPVKSRQERLRVMHGPLDDIPVERTPRWIEAYSRERVLLGLQPYPDKP
jgi:hypothetical protein